MAFDSARRVTVLFTFNDSRTLAETWEWNGAIWALKNVSGPSPRASHAMAYDVVRGETVLFGGWVHPSAGPSGETWEWDGITWTQRSVSGPAPRRAPRMVYDTVRGVTVLFGGYVGPDVTGFESHETWEYGTPCSLAAVAITQHPSPKVVATGTTATFTVTAVSTAPFTYL